MLRGGTKPIDDTTRGDLQRAREARIANHYYRKHVLDCLREGHLTLAEFRTMRVGDKRLMCLRTKTVVYACVGKRRGNRFLLELGIDGDQLLKRLGPRQWADLVGRVDSARPRTAR